MHAVCLPVIGEDRLYVVFCQICRQALSNRKVQHFQHCMLIMPSLPAPPSCQKEDIWANRLGILRLQVPSSVFTDQPTRQGLQGVLRSGPFLQGRHGQDRPKGLPCLCLGLSGLRCSSHGCRARAVSFGVVGKPDREPRTARVGTGTL